MVDSASTSPCSQVEDKFKAGDQTAEAVLEWLMERRAFRILLVASIVVAATGCHRPTASQKPIDSSAPTTAEGESAVQPSETNTNSVRLAALSPDGKDLIVAASPDLLIRFDLASLADAESNARGQVLLCHTVAGINGLAFAPNNQWLAAVEDGATGPSRIFVFGADDGNYFLRQIIHGAEDYAEMKFSDDGSQLVFASYNLVQVSDPDTGRTLWSKAVGEDLSWQTTLITGRKGPYAWINAGSEAKPKWQLWDPLAHRQVAGSALSLFPPEGSQPIVFKRQNAFYAIRQGVVTNLATKAKMAGLPTSDRGRVSPDGKWCCVRTPDKKALDVYSLTDCKKVFRLTSKDSIFSQDWIYLGTHAVANIIDGLEVWDLNTGKNAINIVPYCGIETSDGGIEVDWLAYLPSGAWFGSVNPKDANIKNLNKKDAKAIAKAIAEVFSK